jgi:hypothetical protein
VLALGVVIYNSGGPWRKVLVLNRDAKRCFLSDSSISSDNLSAGTLLVMVDPTMIDQDLDLKEKLTSVIDRATQDAIALLLTQREAWQPSVESSPDWMTATQLARYGQLVNSNGEPTTAGILKWARRSENEHPLPHAYMGDLLRFHRTEVDLWAKQEAERRRVQNEQRRLKIA